ncbi:VanZ family protein [Priestia aryabhattai]|uniref:VanZ family protein n=1 Tax=Priestia aryabhattai TaxID=412384 RepID=UPI000BF000E0|nr:VanZ family protein [Priestia aryabhattai]PEI51828.1 hypothetical protein CN635_24965 [Priestia aryabhattai]
MKNKIINITWLGSVLFIIDLTMLPRSSLDIGIGLGGINIIPLHTIGGLFVKHSFNDFIINNVGNIILFVPFGFLSPLKFRSIDNSLKVCLVGMLFSVLIEVVQLFMPNRWTDIDDIILNVLGTWVGYNIFNYLSNFQRVNIGKYEKED